MSAQSQRSVVIECPHCRTRYMVPAETLGAKGRTVACAHCGETWTAEGVAAEVEDPLDLAVDEDRLDAEFSRVERAVRPNLQDMVRQKMAEGGDIPPDVLRSLEQVQAAIAPRPKPVEARPASVASQAETPTDAVAQRRTERDFARRQRVLSARLPTSRVRRLMRTTAGSLLAVIVIAGIAFRTDIVRFVPDLAGAYAAIGLGVNVVGLEFSDVTTLMSLKNDRNVISVDARIRGVTDHTVLVPPVVVTLIDAAGKPIYQWSVAPTAADLKPGEVLDFTTELNNPPAGAQSVRLTFATGVARASVASTPPAAPMDKS